MLVPHLHLCNQAGFRDNAAKSGKPGHNRDIGPKSGTVPAKPGHLATMGQTGDDTGFYQNVFEITFSIHFYVNE